MTLSVIEETDSSFGRFYVMWNNEAGEMQVEYFHTHRQAERFQQRLAQA